MFGWRRIYIGWKLVGPRYFFLWPPEWYLPNLIRKLKWKWSTPQKDQNNPKLYTTFSICFCRFFFFLFHLFFWPHAYSFFRVFFYYFSFVCLFLFLIFGVHPFFSFLICLDFLNLFFLISFGFLYFFLMKCTIIHKFLIKI